MESSECGMIRKCGVTFFVYLEKVLDQLVGAVGGGGVFEYTKSGVCIIIVVFATACRRTANTFASNMSAFGDVFVSLIF